MTVDEMMEFMLAAVPEGYDVSEGSFFYDILKPVAYQMYLLQSRISDLQENTFAMTAAGEYLDRKAAEQGIIRNAAEFAKGSVIITGTKGEVVLKGSLIAAEDVLFAVDETVTIPNSGSVEVTATCTRGGLLGNVRAGAINRFPVTLRGIKTVTNPEPFTGGYDMETDAALLERYIEKVSRPNVSGNKYHYIQWAKEVSSAVGDVQVIPLWNGAGTVKVVIVDSDNQPATAELISEVQAHIEESRPIGADVTVVSATALQINVSVTLMSNNAASIHEDVENAIREYLSSAALKKEYVSYAKIGGLILSVNGVEDYSNLKVNNGTANIALADGVVPVLGSVNIS